MTQSPADLKQKKQSALISGIGGHDADIPHAHLISTAPFELREDGSIQKMKGSATVPVALFGVPPNKMPEDVSSATPDTAGGTPALPRLIFTSDNPFIRLYHGNSLELLDAIAAKYPEGRFDAIFADPPYFLSNGGITCHAGKMVKVDKGDWDVSRGPELNHEFNREWLRRCQRVLKPNGTIWVTGTHHVIFSIGYALQQLGFKILNDIAWEKPNPPPEPELPLFHPLHGNRVVGRQEREKQTRLQLSGNAQGDRETDENRLAEGRIWLNRR